MTRAHIFSDEAGCFKFRDHQRFSRYFMVCTVAMEDCDITHSLLDLRRDVVWRGLPVSKEFRATADKNDVRGEVCSLLSDCDFRTDVVFIENRKISPKTVLLKTGSIGMPGFITS